jgi:hypothetical protein
MRVAKLLERPLHAIQARNDPLFEAGGQQLGGACGHDRRPRHRARVSLSSRRGTTMLKTGWHPITELPNTGPKTAITWENEYGQAGLNSLHYIIAKREMLVYTALSRRECGPHGSRCAAPNNTIREVYYGKCRFLV